jgi:hypothetical protein
MVKGLMTNVKAALIATFARMGIASTAAMKVCMNGMITPTNNPTATPRDTERRVIRQSAGWRRCGANGRRKRLW